MRNHEGMFGELYERRYFSELFPKKPQLPEPTPLPTRADPEIARQADLRKRRRQKAFGVGQTILTPPKLGDAPTETASLLGGSGAS